MKKLRGYIFSRAFMGERAPQHVQNIILHDYCQKRGYKLLLSAAEYAMPDSYMVLESVLDDLANIDGIIFYSLYQLPTQPEKRRLIYSRVLDAQKSLHFAVEEKVISSVSEIQTVEEIIRVLEVFGRMITEKQDNAIGKLQNFITPLHQLSKREYLPRMNDEKVHCMTVAKQYGVDYWDGERRYGYGGYFYRPGYWTPVAQKLIDTYSLKPGSKVLDIGCGKGFLLHELLLLEPQLQVLGTDISQYAISQATELVKPLLKIQDTRGKFLYEDKEFDLVISINMLHNLRAFDLENALIEIQRIGKSKYVAVESYRNDLELFNLQCWAKTCESFFDYDEWIWVFEKVGYSGDYEFIYFE